MCICTGVKCVIAWLLQHDVQLSFQFTSCHYHSHCTSQLDLFILLMVVITFTVLKAGHRRTKVRCAVSGNHEVKFVLSLFPHTLYELSVFQ